MRSRHVYTVRRAGLITILAVIAIVIIFATRSTTPTRHPPPLATPGPRNAQFTTTALSANKAALFGTFQSNNQRLAYSPGGIFMSYVVDWNRHSDAATGVIVRSTNGGASWRRILTVRLRDHDPATLQTDSAGNVYAFQSGPVSAPHDAFMYIFPRSADYTNNGSNYLVLNHGYSGKFASAYDPSTNRLFYANWYGLYTVTLGSTRATADSYSYLHMFRADCGETVEYPLLYVDRSDPGLVVLAYSATKHAAPRPSYYEDRFIVSTDNGTTWQGRSGTISHFPFNFAGCDGPSWLVNEPSQITGLDDYWWLDSVYAQGGYLLFVYSDRQGALEYRRFNWSERRFDVTIGLSQCLGAAPLCPEGLGAFFSGEGRRDSRIYLSGSNRPDQKVDIWYSDDEGASWRDYASTPRLGDVTYACSGMPQLGPNGEVMGAVTILRSGADNSTVYFFHTI